MTTIEDRVSRLEGAYEQVDRRLEDLGASMQAVRGEMSSLRTDMDGRFDSLRGDMNGRFDSLHTEMNSRLNNIYMLMGGLWATIVAGIVAMVVTN